MVGDGPSHFEFCKIFLFCQVIANFMNHLKKAPYDFSLDLYLLFVANRVKISIKSFPVFFSNREFGEAKGGGTLKGKFKLIKRTIGYIIELRNDIIKGNR